VFPVRYELNLYMLFRRNSVFKGLITYKVSPYSQCNNSGAPVHISFFVSKIARRRKKCTGNKTHPILFSTISLPKHFSLLKVFNAGRKETTRKT
jgi:hypothetical protein